MYNKQLVSKVNVNFLGLRRFNKEVFEEYDNIEYINNFNDVLNDKKWYYGESKRILYKNERNNYIYVSHDLFSILTTIEDHVIELLRIYRKSYSGYFLISDISGNKSNIRVDYNYSADNIISKFYDIISGKGLYKIVELRNFVLERIKNNDTKVIKTNKVETIALPFEYLDEERSIIQLEYLKNPEILYDKYKDKTPINIQRTRDAIIFYKSLFERNIYGTQEMWENFIDYIDNNHYHKFRDSLISHKHLQLNKPKL